MISPDRRTPNTLFQAFLVPEERGVLVRSRGGRGSGDFDREGNRRRGDFKLGEYYW